MFDMYHCVNLRYATCSFDTFIYWHLIVIVSIISTSLTIHNIISFWWWE